MADGIIRIPVADQTSGGKVLDTTEFTRYDNTVVEHERVEIPSGVNVDGDTLRQVLVELRLTNTLLAQMAGITDDLEQLRSNLASEDILN